MVTPASPWAATAPGSAGALAGRITGASADGAAAATAAFAGVTWLGPAGTRAAACTAGLGVAGLASADAAGGATGALGRAACRGGKGWVTLAPEPLATTAARAASGETLPVGAASAMAAGAASRTALAVVEGVASGVAGAAGGATGAGVAAATLAGFAVTAGAGAAATAGAGLGRVAGTGLVAGSIAATGVSPAPAGSSQSSPGASRNTQTVACADFCRNFQSQTLAVASASRPPATRAACTASARARARRWASRVARAAASSASTWPMTWALRKQSVAIAWVSALSLLAAGPVRLAASWPNGTTWTETRARRPSFRNKGVAGSRTSWPSPTAACKPAGAVRHKPAASSAAPMQPRGAQRRNDDDMHLSPFGQANPGPPCRRTQRAQSLAGAGIYPLMM